MYQSGLNKKSVNIAIIVPIYNEKTYISNSLNSILNQKIESNIHLHIICVFNNSSDGSKDIVTDLIEKSQKDNVFWYVKEQIIQGIVPARNLGLETLSVIEKENNFKFDFVANQDADDVWFSESKLQKQVDFLKDNPEIDVVGGQYLGRAKYVETKPENYIKLERRPLEHDECLLWLLRGHNPIGNASALFRRDILYRVGVYDDFFPFVEDMWFWYKVAFAGYKLSNLEEDVLLYNMSNNPSYSPKFPVCLSLMFKTLIETKTNKLVF